MKLKAEISVDVSFEEAKQITIQFLQDNYHINSSMRQIMNSVDSISIINSHGEIAHKNIKRSSDIYHALKLLQTLDT